MAVKKGFKVFLISFLVSLIILGSLFGAFLLYMKSNRVDTPQENVPYKSNFTPTASESWSILILGCENKGKAPLIYHLFHYSALDGSIYLIPIPSQTVATVDTKTATINEHYDYYGLDGAINASENLFLTDIESYVRLDSNQMSDFVNFFSGIEFDVESEAKYESTTVGVGNQLLDGRRYTALMYACATSNPPNMKLQGELFEKLVRTKFNKSLETNFDKLCDKIFATNDSNINQYDIIRRKKVFLHYVSSQKMLVKSLHLKGEYKQNQTQFIIDDNCIDEISKLIKITY